jgi:hypothetical protein
MARTRGARQVGPGPRGPGARATGPAARGSLFARAARVGAALVGLAGAGAATLSTSACGPGTCLLKICVDGRCRCSISTCGEGADFDTRQNRCRCLAGRIALAGQCLTPVEANAYCGKGRVYASGGCQEIRCAPGELLDLGTGQCAPAQAVGQVGASMGVPVGSGQTLGCPAGQKVVLDGATAACVPAASTCAPDETWSGQACVKVGACPTGFLWDAAKAQCVKYASGSGDDELRVDVAAWTVATFGPMGGDGVPGFCGAFAKKPWTFGVAAGTQASVRIAITSVFPDGEVAKGAAQSITVFDLSGSPVPGAGAALVDAEVKARVGLLAQNGGRASAGSAQTTVRCLVVNAAKPQAVPASGGL